MAAREYTYYDADGNSLGSPYACVQRWQWDKEMPGVEPKFIKGYGYVYGYRNNVRARVERIVGYKAHGASKHKCDARCTHAKGGNCECECGGKNHGAGN